MHRYLVSLPLKHREDPQRNTGVQADEDREALYAYLYDKCLHKVSSGTRMVPLNLVDFKIGTLDAMVVASETTTKIEQVFEAVIDRLKGFLSQLNAFMPNTSDPTTQVYIDDRDPEEFLENFSWNMMKYRVDLPIKEIAEGLEAEIQQLDNLVKVKMTLFSQSKAEIDAVQRGKSGSLAVRDLNDLINDEDLVESEFMETLAVVVPREFKGVWESSYTTLCEMVVPDSSKLITQDDHNYLFIVTIFRKFRPDFVRACSSNRYTVRDCYRKEESSGGRVTSEQLEGMQAGIQAQWSSLVRLVRSNLGEAHGAFVHLKALRLFVESVLRYGLPSQYLFLYIRLPDEKSRRTFNKRLLHSLETLKLPGISEVDLTTALQFLGQEDAAGRMDAQEAELWSAINLAGQELDPFVKLSLNLKI